MAKPRMREMASRSWSAERIVGTTSTVSPSGNWGQKVERNHVPQSLVDSAVRKDLPVVRELQFALDQAVRELAGFDGERVDVARDLLVVLGHPFAEHDFEHAVTRLACRAIDQRNEMRRERDRYRRGRGHREHRPRE